MLQEKKIEKNDNFISLSNKLSKLGSKLILKSLDIIEAKNQNLKIRMSTRQLMQIK